jgi:hypothetical protein
VRWNGCALARVAQEIEAAAASERCQLGLISPPGLAGVHSLADSPDRCPSLRALTGPGSSGWPGRRPGAGSSPRSDGRPRSSRHLSTGHQRIAWGRWRHGLCRFAAGCCRGSLRAAARGGPRLRTTAAWQPGPASSAEGPPGCPAASTSSPRWPSAPAARRSSPEGATRAAAARTTSRSLTKADSSPQPARPAATRLARQAARNPRRTPQDTRARHHDRPPDLHSQHTRRAQ